GHLPQQPSDRMPVLTDHQHPVVLVDRDDADRPRMGDHLPGDDLCLIAAAHPHPVDADSHDPAAERLGAVHDLPAFGPVADPFDRLGRSAHETATASTPRRAVAYSMAAATSPANSGCGRV